MTRLQCRVAARGQHVVSILALVCNMFALTAWAQDFTVPESGKKSGQIIKEVREIDTPEVDPNAIILPDITPLNVTSRYVVLRGDAKCARCHDEGDAYPVLAIGKTRHGTVADQRTPTCSSCHGDSDTHISNPQKLSDRPLPDRTFGKKSLTPAAVQNQACLTCHQGGKRMHWAGSLHATRGTACIACHQVHTQHDKVRDKVTQSEVCFTCHKDKRAEIMRPSRHSISEGKVACSDCHNPHGSAGRVSMVRDNVNDTCYTCHMEKRGPFVRNHQPVHAAFATIRMARLSPICSKRGHHFCVSHAMNQPDIDLSLGHLPRLVRPRQLRICWRAAVSIVIPIFTVRIIR